MMFNLILMMKEKAIEDEFLKEFCRD